MKFVYHFFEANREMFVPMKADSVHPHDHLIDRTVLRFLPSSITPNEVTLFRLIATPMVFFLILYGYFDIGILCFVLVAFTDVIDGSMARTRNQITKFGILFDPLADKFLIGSLVFLLIIRYYPNVLIGVIVIALEAIFIIMAAVFEYKFKTVRMANMWGKLKMMLQVLAVFIILLALLLDEPALFTTATAFFGLAIGAAVVSLFSHGI